jgi:hypothetical protein
LEAVARDTTGDYMLDGFAQVRILSMPSKPPNFGDVSRGMTNDGNETGL